MLMFMKKVAIIMGSDSDLPIAEKAVNVLKDFNVPFEVHVFSAHRTPVEAKAFSENAKANGFGVIIAIAGMAAHLAGAIAANTTLPVIGIPVATVAIDGGANAALLALEILAVSDDELSEKLVQKRKNDTAVVLEKNKAIEEKFNF